MYVTKDCISQTTTSTGTGDFILSGVRSGYDSFVSRLTALDYFVYEAHGVDAAGARSGEFEIGMGQFWMDGLTPKIRRLRKLSGSNYPSSGLVAFSSGNKVVSITASASQVDGLAIGQDQSGDDPVLYVRSGGNDSNTGLANTDAQAFATISAALSAALSRYRYATIMVGAGSFSGGSNGAGVGSVEIIGASAATTTIAGILAGSGQSISVSGCTFVDSSAAALYASGSGSYIYAENVIFGDCEFGHAVATEGGKIELGLYEISGGAASGAHLLTERGGMILCGDVATVLSDVTFSDGWALCRKGHGLIDAGIAVDLDGHTVTGKRYDITGNGVCNTYGGGTSFLPGSVSGTTASGGQYL